MVVMGLLIVTIIFNVIFIPVHGYFFCEVVYLYISIKGRGTGWGHYYLIMIILPALLLVNFGVLLYALIYYYMLPKYKAKYQYTNYSQKFNNMEKRALRATKFSGVMIYSYLSIILSITILTLGVELK